MSEKFAVVLGRFQPFHLEHERMIRKVREKFDNIVVLIGEMQPGKDQFHYIDRAHFMKNFLRSLGFVKYAVQPMYDFDDWDAWGSRVWSSCVNAAGTDNLVLIKSMKQGDIDHNGDHYLDYLDRWIFSCMELKVTNDDIHATMIRNEPEKFAHLVHKNFKRHVVEKVGNPSTGAELETIWESPGKTKWMNVKRVNMGFNDFFFSQRRNSDSVAFIIHNTDTNKYGVLIEAKPPIGVLNAMSAFGGGFDIQNDDPYRIVRQEVLEESGIADFWPVYKGSYMATTQSDEIVHLFEVRTTETEFNPQTEDDAELRNRCIWLELEEALTLADWRIHMILKKD